jgi:hypothetical protein
MGGGESPNVATLAADANPQATPRRLSPSASPVVDTQAAASSGETAGEQGKIDATCEAGLRYFRYASAVAASAAIL